MKKIIALVSTVFLLGFTTLFAVGCGSSSSSSNPPPKTGLDQNNPTTWIGNYEVVSYKTSGMTVSADYDTTLPRNSFLVFGNFSITVPDNKTAGALQVIGYSAMDSLKKTGNVPVTEYGPTQHMKDWVDVVKFKDCNFTNPANSAVHVIDSEKLTVSCVSGGVTHTLEGKKVNNEVRTYDNYNPTVYSNEAFTYQEGELNPANLIGNYIIKSVDIIDPSNGNTLATIDHDFNNNKSIGELTVKVNLISVECVEIVMSLKWQYDNSTLDASIKNNLQSFIFPGSFTDRINIIYENGTKPFPVNVLVPEIFPNEGMNIDTTDNISITYTPKKMKVPYQGSAANCTKKVGSNEYQGYCYDTWLTNLDNRTFGNGNGYVLKMKLVKIISTGNGGGLEEALDKDPRRILTNSPYWANVIN